MERYGIYPPRGHRYKPLGAIYGAAFTGGPVPVLRQLTGKPSERPYGLVATNSPGKLVEWLISIGAIVRGGIRYRHFFTHRGTVTRNQVVENAYITHFRYSNGRRGNEEDRASVVLCPAEFSDASIDQFFQGEPVDLALDLATWAYDYSEWCREIDVPIKTSSGGQGAVFLRDERFWPEPRARVSRRYNELAREVIPGNYYRLLNPGTHMVVSEYDQISAHHTSAATAHMTDSNTLGMANLRGDDKIICRPGTRDWYRLVKRPGLHRLLIKLSPNKLEYRIPFPFIEELHGREIGSVWVWSSELDAVVNEPGIEIVGAIATLSSSRSSPGLSNFARWAISELERNLVHAPSRMVWLKGLLVSTYGVMAMPPRPGIRWSTIPSRDAKTASKAIYGPLVISGSLINAYQYGDRKRYLPDPPFINVLDRGIIEADTRKQSILRAREFTHQEIPLNVIAIYSDSLLIAGKLPQGMLFKASAYGGSPDENENHYHPETGDRWRVKRELTNLTTDGPTRWRADQDEKLPGTPRKTRRERPPRAIVSPVGRG